MIKPTIEADIFRKVYEQDTAADNISFNVYQGEIFGLLGPNGAERPAP